MRLLLLVLVSSLVGCRGYNVTCGVYARKHFYESDVDTEAKIEITRNYGELNSCSVHKP